MLQWRPGQHSSSVSGLQIASNGRQSRDSGRAEVEACMANAKTRSMTDFKNCIVERFWPRDKVVRCVAGAAELRRWLDPSFIPDAFKH
jgi:hypothetical protein